MRQQLIKKQIKPQRILTKLFFLIFYYFYLLIILTSQDQLRLIKLISSSTRRLVLGGKKTMDNGALDPCGAVVKQYWIGESCTLKCVKLVKIYWQNLNNRPSHFLLHSQ